METIHHTDCFEIQEGPAVCLIHPDGTIQVQRLLMKITRDENGIITNVEKGGIVTLPEIYVIGERTNEDEAWIGPVIYKPHDFTPYKLVQIEKEETSR